VLLVGVPVVVFGRSFGFEFVKWDDPLNIPLNPYFHPLTIGNVARLWTISYFGLYIPLTYTFFAVLAAVNQLLGLCNSAGGPFDPRIYHVANVALHIGSTLLVYQLLRKFIATRLAACCGALLFAVHPIQVESVCWVSEAKGLLSTFFALAAILLFVHRRQQQLDAEEGSAEKIAPRPTNFGWATGLFLLALLAKPSAVSVPLIVWVIDRLYFQRSMRQATTAMVDWIVMAIAWVFITRIAQPNATMEITWPLWSRPLVALDALSFYLKQVVVPIHLAIDYGRSPTRILANGEIYWTWIAVAVVGAVLFARPSWRLPRLAAAIAVIVLLPVLGLIPFGFQQLSTVADRYAYLAMLGPAIFLAWLLSRSPRIVWFGGMLFLAILSVRSWNQSIVWHDSFALFEHALDVNPDSFASTSNLAVIYQEKGQIETAEKLFCHALELSPTLAEANIGLASILVNRGDLDQAFDHFQRALDKSPQSDRANAGIAVIYLRRGETQRAIEHFRRALTPDPSIAAPTLLGNKRAAIADRLARILATSPRQESRHGEEALSWAKEAVELTKSRCLMCLDTLAAAYAELGQFEKAIHTVEDAAKRAQRSKDFEMVDLLMKHRDLFSRHQALRERPKVAN